MSAVPWQRVVTTAYEHVKGSYGSLLENLEVFDSKKILRIPSSMGKRTLQFKMRTQDFATYVGFSI